MNSRQNITAFLRRELNKVFKRKNEGSGTTLLIGTVTILVIAIMFVAMTGSLSVKNKVEIVEDSLTSAGLGSLKIDTEYYAVTGKHGVNTDKAYEDVCRLVADNLVLNRNGCAYSGNDKIANGGSYLSKVYIFTPDESGVMQRYEYIGKPDGTHTKSKTTTDISEQGEKVEKASIYIEYAYKVNFLGSLTEVKKGSLVTLWQET